ELSIQGLNGVRRVDGSSHFWREVQERRDFVPAFAPGLTNHWILVAPHFFELLQRSLSGFDVGGRVDFPQVGADALAVLPANESRGGTHHVNDARLKYCPRKSRFYRLG